MKGSRVLVWHPDSPGSKVTVWRPWWKRKNRPFASLAELHRTHGIILDATRDDGVL